MSQVINKESVVTVGNYSPNSYNILIFVLPSVHSLTFILTRHLSLMDLNDFSAPLFLSFFKFLGKKSIYTFFIIIMKLFWLFWYRIYPLIIEYVYCRWKVVLCEFVMDYHSGSWVLGQWLKLLHCLLLAMFPCVVCSRSILVS